MTTSTIIKIDEIGIQNYKNVGNGEIKLHILKKDRVSDVTGIFGQNGSGKTAVIESLELLKIMLCGSKVPLEFAEKISNQSKTSHFSFKFSLKKDGQESWVFYNFSLKKKKSENDLFDSPGEPQDFAEVFDEELRFSIENQAMKICQGNGQDPFLPKCLYKQLFGTDEDLKTDLLVARKLASSSSSSFFFGGSFYKLLKKANSPGAEKLSSYLLALQNFAEKRLFVVTTKENALNSFRLLPLSFNLHEEGSEIYGSLPFDLNGVNSVDESAFNLLNTLVDKFNCVLPKIVQGLALELSYLGPSVSKEGKPLKTVYLSAIRGNDKFPLKYESEGIRKIISILHLLICVFNEEGITVAIDELDSGIFEYLLGELLLLISEKGKGQLIFTCHNLRPLELLNYKTDVIFTSVNPDCRFVRFAGVQKTNTLRDLYYREIMVGTQKTPLYQSTNNSDISFGFRDALGL